MLTDRQTNTGLYNIDISIQQMRYEMFEGDFRIPDGYKQPTMAEGSRYRISDIYHLQIDPEIVAFVGIMPGWRVSTVVIR